MKIHRIEFTHIPQCQKGRQFADEYVTRLKSQDAFRGRKDSTQFISVYAEYSFEVKMDGMDMETGEEYTYKIDEAHCGNCDCLVGADFERYDRHFCPNCGQKIDWSCWE